MKPVPVAPAPAPLGAAASLLHFYRDAMDRLALLRLTERDPELLDCIAYSYGELLASGGRVVQKMRGSGLLDQGEKMPGLHLVHNPVHNPKTPGSR